MTPMRPIPLIFALLIIGFFLSSPPSAHAEQLSTLPYTCVDSHVERAFAYAAQKKYSRAASRLALAREIPDWARDYLRAHYYGLDGQRGKRRKLLLRLAEGDSPLAPRAAFEAAAYPFQRKKNRKAMELYRIASRHPSLRGRAGIRLALLFDRMGDPEKGAEELVAALPHIPWAGERVAAILDNSHLFENREECVTGLMHGLYFAESDYSGLAEGKLKRYWKEQFQDVRFLKLLLTGSRYEWRKELASFSRKASTHRFEIAMLDGIIAKKGRKEKRAVSLKHFDSAFRLAGSGLREAMALYFRSRSLEALDRDLEAKEVYETIVRLYPEFPLSRNLDPRMAAISLREGLPLQAAAYLQQSLDDACPGENLSDTLWLSGFVDYLAGNYDAAASRWSRLASEYFFELNHKWIHYGPMALYWQAKALLGAGKTAEAGDLLQILASEFDGNYYGLRAGQLLADSGVEVPSPAPGRLETSPLAVPGSVTLPSQFEAALTLFRLGLWEEAYDEFRTLVGIGRIAAGVAPLMLSSYLRFNSIVDSISYRRTHGMMLTAPWEGGARLWRLSLPLSFVDAIEAGEKASSLNRAFAASIIRFESNFNPRVVSHAGAIGLLQVKRSTGTHVAVPCLNQKRVSKKELMEPRRNLELGSFYVAELAIRHHGNKAVCLAAYNAGPRTAKWWLERFSGLDTDEFVEQITYPNTSAYVKRILGVVPIYWSLYFPVLGKKGPEPPRGEAIPPDLRPFLDEKGGTCAPQAGQVSP